MYDCLIVGAGSMGMAASYYLAKQGVSVCAIDAFNPPHAEGSHHGETRIIRYAYGEGKEYVPLALRSATLWKELEVVSGRTLFEQTGVCTIARQDSAFLQTVIDSAHTFDLPLEVLGAREASSRWPGIRVPDTMRAAFEPTSGVLHVESCVAAFKEQALLAGAELKMNEPVLDIAFGDTISVTTVHATYTAKQVIICAGAWTDKLLNAYNLPLQPIRKTFAWFDAPEELYEAKHFPAFIYELPHEMYYGFPSINGAGYKVGRHDQGEEIDPALPLRPFDPADAQELASFTSSYMPKVGAIREGKVCKYTMTPDEHFIIDRLPQHENAIIACGFSGHGFKFASGIGEMLAEMVLHGTSTLRNERFQLSRFT